MAKKADVLGLRIDNYTCRSSVSHAENFLNNRIVNDIQMLFLDTLNEAEKDSEIGEYIENVDLSVVADVEILPLIKVDSKTRKRDIEDATFVRLFLKRIRESGKTVCILAESEESASYFADYISDIGKEVSLSEPVIAPVDAEDFNWEKIVNDINSKNVGVVISLLDIIHNKDLMNGYKGQLSIEVFWGIDNNYRRFGRSSGFFGSIRKAIFRKFVYRRANKYTD